MQIKNLLLHTHKVKAAIRNTIVVISVDKNNSFLRDSVQGHKLQKGFCAPNVASLIQINHGSSVALNGCYWVILYSLGCTPSTHSVFLDLLAAQCRC